MSIVIYIAVMAGVTYLIRMIPFTFFRKKIKSRFFRSFLYYIPYAVLSAMTFPAILSSTGNFASALVGLIVGAATALWGRSLLTVALSSCAGALVVELFLTFL